MMLYQHENLASGLYDARRGPAAASAHLHVLLPAAFVVLLFGLTPTSAQGLRSVKPMMKEYCFGCHAGNAREGELALDKINWHPDGLEDVELWRMILQRVKFGEMPPTGAEQPSDKRRRKLLDAIRRELLRTQVPGSKQVAALRLPQYGNYVDHTALFDVPPSVVIPCPPRLWRLRPRIYEAVFIGAVELPERLGNPLSVMKGREFKDYATEYFIDEPTANQLLANAESLVRIRSRGDLETLIASDDEEVRNKLVSRVIRTTFQTLLHRPPTDQETHRYERLHCDLLKTSGKRVAAERLLIAIYMSPKALFREELGDGPPDEHGRIRLSQRETALALSYALGDRPDPQLIDAAARGTLATSDQVAAHVQVRLERPPVDGNPRVLQFFREYFDYPRAVDVFKDQPTRGAHLPQMLINDLDLLIQHVVAKDQEVLFELLTTDRYFVDCVRDPATGVLRQASVGLAVANETLNPRNPEHATIYGLPRDWIWTQEQPVAVPRNMRAGVLTHPAWLVAWSGNFDNQPVQRGKWIRTRLLGGNIPEVPLDVDATVPEDRQKQLRERLAIATASSRCQRCHRHMDPLGLPFEQFDHYGRFRSREADRPVDTSGAIAFVDEASLIGEVSDPIELVERLAKSQFVEQVFVRHAFRFFLGRNETLGDAGTLQEAHQAYRAGDGSFRALVTSLLASDSFLYRSAEANK